MSKPRIVRENVYASLHEVHKGAPWLALPWPTDCPYTPEQVMAACERDGCTLIGVPVLDPVKNWRMATYRNIDGYIGLGFGFLTPGFIGEPKRCDHDGWAKCWKCGAILSDRRKGERRKGERRKTKQLGSYQKGDRRTRDNWQEGQRKCNRRTTP